MTWASPRPGREKETGTAGGCVEPAPWVRVPSGIRAQEGQASQATVKGAEQRGEQGGGGTLPGMGLGNTYSTSLLLIPSGI